MLRTYENKKIYKNFRVVEILSDISTILSAIITIIYTINKYLVNPSAGIEVNQILFYIFAIMTPLNLSIYSARSQNNKNLIGKVGKGWETKLNNDFTNTLTVVILSFNEITLLFLHFLIGAISFALSWAYYCGYMLIPHIPVYIAAGFLIHNCVLIKREWENDPPEFYLKKQRHKEEKQRQSAQNKKVKTYKKLIQKCGIRFFINYYSQIKHLPLRDVTIKESYSVSEKEERLLAAKKLINLNLTEFTITQILKEYRNFLSEADIDKAKAILSEQNI